MAIIDIQQVINRIIDSIGFLTETWLFYMFLSLFMPKKYPSKIYILGAFIAHTLISIMCNVIFHDSEILWQNIVRQILLTLLDFVFCWALFKLKSKKARYIMYMGLFYIFTALMEDIFVSTCYVFFPDFDILITMEGYVPQKIILLAIVRLVYFSIIVLLKRFLGDYLWNFGWNRLLLISIISALFTRIYFLYYYNQEFRLNDELMMILAILLGVINAFVLYHVVTLQSATEKYIQARAAIERRNDFKVMMEAFQESARNFMHNIRDKLTLPLMTRLNLGQYEDAEKLVLDFDKRLLDLSPVDLTGNYDLDALLIVKRKEAEERGVHLHVEGHWPEETGIFPGDLGSLLGSVLDNAIEATQKFDGQKEVSAVFCCNAPRLTFEVSNPYDGKLKRNRSGEILSTKPMDGGLGIKIIKAMAKKYGGYADIDFNQDFFIVSVTLMIQKIEADKEEPKQLIGKP